MKTKLFAAVAAIGLLASSATSAMAEWKPAGPIKLIIAFAAGGGADTQARLIAENLEKNKGWKIIPENVTGKGGVNALAALKKEPADGSAIAMVVTESMGYNLVAAAKSGLKPSDFTSLTTTAGFQMGVVARTEKGWKSWDDVVAAAKGGQQIRFGVMSPKLADLAYLLGQTKGVEFNTVMLRGGKGVMNALNAGDVDVGWLAGIQRKPVAAGDMVNLVSGLSTPLVQTPEAPTMKDLGVDFNADGYFMFAAPAGMDAEARKGITDAIVAIISDESTKAGGLIKKAFGGAAVITGADLDAEVVNQYESAGALMKASE